MSAFDRDTHRYSQIFQLKALVSNREKELLQLLSHGLNSTEIAARLYISEHTVMSHRKNLISKLNARNTADLIRIGFVSQMLHV